MPKFEVQIGLYIDADSNDAVWNKVKSSGLHDLLNELDAEGHYYAELVGKVETEPI